MSAFADHLRALIDSEGPQPLERVMALAVGDPALGYYATREPFGVAGDFITAPEISQMFGELIGLWCAVTHELMGSPPTIALVELGPGRGTLMADALRATARIERFSAARRVHLIESSPRLRDIQAARLAPEPVAWHARLEEVPAGPALIIANEFFDALPVRQLVAKREGWRERLVGLDDATGAFKFEDETIPPRDLPAWLPPAAGVPVGTIAEASPAREAVARSIAQRLAREGGAALVIDYGHGVSAPGETLQAVRAHKPVAVLDSLGEADLTAHVDFAALARSAREAGTRAHGPIGQGRFLQALGIGARAGRLLRHATPAQAVVIEAALERLTAPAAMGEIFKVMAFTRPDLPTPAGFESERKAARVAPPEPVHG